MSANISAERILPAGARRGITRCGVICRNTSVDTDGGTIAGNGRGDRPSAVGCQPLPRASERTRDFLPESAPTEGKSYIGNSACLKKRLATFTASQPERPRRRLILPAEDAIKTLSVGEAEICTLDQQLLLSVRPKVRILTICHSDQAN